jgi:hypothetical protein
MLVYPYEGSHYGHSAIPSCQTESDPHSLCSAPTMTCVRELLVVSTTMMSSIF